MPNVVRTYVVDVMDDGNLMWKELTPDGERVPNVIIGPLASMFRDGHSYCERELTALRVAQLLKSPRIVTPSDGFHI